MRWKLISSILVVLVIIPSLLRAHDFSLFGNILCSRSQSSCDTSQCDSQIPECPNCVSMEDSIDPFLPEDTNIYQKEVVSALILLTPEGLLDQGFVRSIFHPPTSIL